MGALWGCGHDAGQLLFGLLFLLLKDRLHMDLLSVSGGTESEHVDFGRSVLWISKLMRVFE